MRTRTLVLLALLSAAAATRGLGQAAAKPAVAPAPGAPVTVVAESTDVTIKDASAAAVGTATKSKDASGKDTLSVDFPDEDVRNILRNVADLFELNLVIPEALAGKASIKLRDVSWRQIFQVVLNPIGYTYIEDGNIIKIISNESLQQEPVSTEVFIINYARAVDIKPTLDSLVDAAAGGKIMVDARSNSLVITERPSRMNRIRPIIEQLDRATDQVMIESKFVEVTDGDVHNIGVNWASLKGYKLGVGPGGDNGVFGDYARQQTQNRSVGSNGSNATVAGSTSGATSGTNTGTTNGTNGASTSTSTISSANGVPSSSSTTTVTNGLTTTTTSGTTGGTTGSKTNSSTDTVNLLNSLTNGGGTTRALSAVFTADQFGLILSALNEFTSAKVVSNPTVVTLNNTEAFINIGKEYPLPKYTYNEQRGSFEVAGFEYKPIGIILKVTPQVNARGFIKLLIEPTVSSFNDADSVNFGGASGAKIPVIQTKNVKTQISLKDGFTMGIGGLIDASSSNGETKVPVLGSIPVLGRLFSSKSKTTSTRNLLIFLTAKTLSAEGAPPGQIFDPRQIRQMNLKLEDLPGYRDGTDPFATVPTDATPPKKGAKKTSAK